MRIISLGLLGLTACGSQPLARGQQTIGGGEMRVTLTDDASNTELAWVFSGIDSEQLARANVEPLVPLHYDLRGGGLIHYQFGSSMLVAGIGRDGQLGEASLPSFSFQSSGAIPQDCLDEMRVLYLEYSHELTLGGQTEDSAGFLLVKLLDETVQRPNYNSDAITSAVLWDEDHPRLDDFGSVRDPGGYQPPPSAAMDLQQTSPSSGSLTATGVTWKWQSETCWVDWHPDIQIEWDFDPEMERSTNP